ncbi:hypothetical protein [Gracilibacillus lacisalsi]|nr:hypothetical protein [Gracilibacillus lacisalsi]
MIIMKRKKISDQLSDGNYSMVHNLSTNALYLIASMPEQER